MGSVSVLSCIWCLFVSIMWQFLNVISMTLCLHISVYTLCNNVDSE